MTAHFQLTPLTLAGAATGHSQCMYAMDISADALPPDGFHAPVTLPAWRQRRRHGAYNGRVPHKRARKKHHRCRTLRAAYFHSPATRIRQILILLRAVTSTARVQHTCSNPHPTRVPPPHATYPIPACFIHELSCSLYIRCAHALHACIIFGWRCSPLLSWHQPLLSYPIRGFLPPLLALRILRTLTRCCWVRAPAARPRFAHTYLLPPYTTRSILLGALPQRLLQNTARATDVWLAVKRARAPSRGGSVDGDNGADIPCYVAPRTPLPHASAAVARATRSRCFSFAFLLTCIPLFTAACISFCFFPAAATPGYLPARLLRLLRLYRS